MYLANGSCTLWSWPPLVSKFSLDIDWLILIHNLWGGGSLLIGSPYQNTKVIQYAWCWATLGKHDNLRSRNYTKSLPGTLFGTSIPTFSGQMGLTRLVLDSHVEGLENSLDKVSNTLVKFGMLKRGFYNV